MEFGGVNLAAVLVAAISTMVVGFIWYSPMLFARPWMTLMGYPADDKAKQDEMRKGAGKLYGLSFVASLVGAFVLARIIRVTSVHTMLHGLRTGFGVWLGFVTTVQFTDKLFTKKPMALYLINTGYQLVCYLAMGAILAAWAA
jgi:surface polysaccharide O-acyltransferase-like enzyme